MHTIVCPTCIEFVEAKTVFLRCFVQPGNKASARQNFRNFTICYHTERPVPVWSQSYGLPILFLALLGFQDTCSEEWAEQQPFWWDAPS